MRIQILVISDAKLSQFSDRHAPPPSLLFAWFFSHRSPMVRPGQLFSAPDSLSVQLFGLGAFVSEIKGGFLDACLLDEQIPHFVDILDLPLALVDVLFDLFHQSGVLELQFPVLGLQDSQLQLESRESFGLQLLQLRNQSLLLCSAPAQLLEQFRVVLLQELQFHIVLGRPALTRSSGGSALPMVLPPIDSLDFLADGPQFFGKFSYHLVLFLYNLFESLYLFIFPPVQLGRPLVFLAEPEDSYVFRRVAPLLGVLLGIGSYVKIEQLVLILLPNGGLLGIAGQQELLQRRMAVQLLNRTTFRRTSVGMQS